MGFMHAGKTFSCLFLFVNNACSKYVVDIELDIWCMLISLHNTDSHIVSFPEKYSPKPHVSHVASTDFIYSGDFWLVPLLQLVVTPRGRVIG